MNRLALIGMLSLCGLVARAEAPAVWWASYPVKPGERVLVSGGGWGTNGVVVAVEGRDGWREVVPDRVSDSGLIFRLPADAPQQASFEVVDARNGRSPAYRLNVPEAWWSQGDDFDRVTPGGTLRLFGRALKGAKVALRAAAGGGRVYPLRTVSDDEYSATVQVPADVPAGDCEIAFEGVPVPGSRRPASAAGTRIAVAPQRVWRSAKVYDVSAYGAVPDDGICDQDAVEKALKIAAKKGGGGVIRFPRGRFNLNDTLTVPSNTVLRGCSRDATVLCWPDFHTPPRALVELDGGAGVEDMMLSSGLYGTGITTPHWPGFFGKPVSDITLKRLVIRFVTNIHREDRQANDFMRRLNTPGAPIVLPNVTRLTLEDVDLFTDKNCIASGIRLSGDQMRVRRSSFRGTAWVPLSAKRAVFEDNEFAGICISVLPGTRELFWSRNRITDRYSGDREAITHDLRNSAYVCDPLPADVAGRRVTIRPPGDVHYVFPGWVPAPWGRKEQWIGRQVMIVAGRGRGQIRDITAVPSRDVYEMDRPFDITPDATSRFVVGEERCHLLYVDSVFRDASVAVSLFGGAHECIVARNDALRAGGYATWCISGPKGVTTVWDNQFIGNRYVGNMSPVAAVASLDVLGSRSRCSARYFDVHATVLRDNVLDQAVLGLGGFDELAEGNAVSHAPAGIIDFGNASTHFATNNVFRGVGRAMGTAEHLAVQNRKSPDFAGIPWRVALASGDAMPTNDAGLVWKTVLTDRGGRLTAKDFGAAAEGCGFVAECAFDVPEKGSAHIDCGCRTPGIELYADGKLVRDAKADIRPMPMFIFKGGPHAFRVFKPGKKGEIPQVEIRLEKSGPCTGFRYVTRTAKAAGAEICGLRSGDTMMFVDDSITVFGEDWNGGYVRLVEAGLKALGVKIDRNVAAGCGYQSPTMVMYHLPRIAAVRPRLMTFSCGVNDVLHTFSPPGPGRHGTELEPFKKNVAKIFDEADRYGVKVVVLTTTMLREDETNAMNRAIVPYNDFLRAEAARRGYMLADVNKAHHEELRKIKKGDRDRGWLACYDGIHMGERGNKMMATEILKAMGVSKDAFDRVREAWDRMKRERPYGQLVTTSARPGDFVTVNGGQWSWGNPSAVLDGQKLSARCATAENFSFQVPTNAVPGRKTLVIRGANGQCGKPLVLEIEKGASAIKP